MYIKCIKNNCCKNLFFIGKIDENVLTKNIFYNYKVLLRKQPSISTYSANSMILLLLNMLLQYFIHFIETLTFTK